MLNATAGSVEGNITMKMDTVTAMQSTNALIERFNTAFNAHDVAQIMALMSVDVVFENTSPAPDGTRFEGQTAVRAFWEDFFRSSPAAHFDFETPFSDGNHGAVCWTYHWNDPMNGPGHIRGVDIFSFKDGKIAGKYSYVKG
jgi:ketosteroid isomerase-like protein